jgi:ribonuclease VapC
MVVDTSALIGDPRSEPDAEAVARAMSDAPVRRVSAATYVEAAAVVDGSRDPIVSRRLDALLEALEARIEPVTATQAHLARAAYRDFARGSGHPAQLNYGDCFAYALAREIGEPLLFKGDDFIHTDVVPALPDPDR